MYYFSNIFDLFKHLKFMNSYIKETDIAIIGMACKFPGSNDLNSYWENIINGVCCIKQFSEETKKRLTPFEVNSSGEYVPLSGIVSDFKGFDASFFNILPQEAKVMDPNHKVLLECAWQAIEDSGYVNCNNVGVYTSCGKSTYLISNILKNNQFCNNIGVYQMMIGNYNDFASSRISYKFNLKGPSVSLQSACSSSLTALHYAILDLLCNNCEIALVGASTIRDEIGYIYEESGIFSKKGRCLPFDDTADGTVPGSGCGVIVLKKVSKALEDNDHIYAIIKGCSINCDGNDKIGYTAPSINGQKEVICECIAKSGVDPNDIKVIETHGTGTRVGDPIEFNALLQAYKISAKNSCSLGSVKWQIGHLDAAAGIAGIIKGVLCLKNKSIPGSPYLTTINKMIDVENSPFYINKENKNWSTSTSKPRYLAVSSFGLGGTNGHVILMESSFPLKTQDNDIWILPFSAKTQDSLMALVNNFIKWLEKNPDSHMSNIAYTLWFGRKHYKDFRFCLVCNDKDDLLIKLKKYKYVSKKCDDNFFLKLDSLMKMDENDILNCIYIVYRSMGYNFSINVKKEESVLRCLFDLFYNLNLKPVLCVDDNNVNSLQVYKYWGTARKISECRQLEELKFDVGSIIQFWANNWENGKDIKLDNLDNSNQVGYISLPTYQFQNKEYWIYPDILDVSDCNKNLNTSYDIEHTVLSLWSNILGYDNINLQDDFFNLGGDSLAAVHFLSQITAIYSIQMNMAEFMECNSVKEVIIAIESKLSEKNVTKSHDIHFFNDKILFKLKDGNESCPLIIFHPAGGTLYCYHQLLKLNTIQSVVYGVQFPIEFLGQKVKSVPELAVDYEKVISKHFNIEELSLGGYSLGGNIAFEIATIMQQKGKQIRGLYLLDSHSPMVYSKPIENIDSINKCFPYILKNFLGLKMNDDISFKDFDSLYEILKKDNPILSSISKSEIITLFQVWKYNHLSLRGYDHKYKFNGDVHLFEAQEKESVELLKQMEMGIYEKREWQKYIIGNLKIHLVPGNHYTMLSSPNVNVLAEKISKLNI